MSSSFHPETDGSSERSNKTVNQAIRYHVECNQKCNQKGWVRALPVIHFNIMNTVNASTGFSGFQLCMGCSPHVLPPLVPNRLVDNAKSDTDAAKIIAQLLDDMAQARDNLIKAKINQAHHANKHRGKEDVFEVGNKVMLSTFHCRRDYKAGDKNHVTKFMPRYNGPYIILHANPTLSSYTIEMPNTPNVFPTFHASELQRFILNDPTLFPSQEHHAPEPILTTDGFEECYIEHIINQHKCG